MYLIVIDGQTVAEVISPCYVKWDEKLNSFVTCDMGKEEEQAEAVLFDREVEEERESVYADLSDKPYRHFDAEGNPFPVATIVPANEVLDDDDE